MWAGRTQSRKYLARGLLLRGQLNLARDAFVGAEAKFVVARELSDTMQYVPVRVQARRELIKIHEQRGASEAAVRLRIQVKELIADLAFRLKTPDLRRSLERGLGRG